MVRCFKYYTFIRSFNSTYISECQLYARTVTDSGEAHAFVVSDKGQLLMYLYLISEKWKLVKEMINRPG